MLTLPWHRANAPGARHLRDLPILERADVQAHREALRVAATGIGWSFLMHHTDRPAAEPLLSLSIRLQDRAQARAIGLTRGIA